MEGQLPCVFHGILGLDQGPFDLVEPVVEPGEKEAQRSASGECRQGVELGRSEWPHVHVALQEGPALGQVVVAERLEAPGIQADRDVVGEEVVAGEIEVDDAGDLVAGEEHVVGEEVRMDDAGRERPGPAGLQRLEGRFDEFGQALGQRCRAGTTGLEQRAPARDRQGIGPVAPEVHDGGMQRGERGTQRAAAGGIDAPRRMPVEKAHDRRGLAAERLQASSLAVVDGHRAGDGARREMVHEAEKERQVGRVDAFLVDREDVAAGGGLEAIVRVLDPFGDRLQGHELADVVAGQEGREGVIGNRGIDRHPSPDLAREDARLMQARHRLVTPGCCSPSPAAQEACFSRRAGIGGTRKVTFSSVW